MNKNQIMQYVAAILTTLAETGTDCAESTLYMALGMNLQLWHTIRDLMVASDLLPWQGTASV